MIAPLRFVSAALLLNLAWTGTAQIRVAVDATAVIADVSASPFGLNTNTFTDDDANRPPGAKSLRSALAASPLNAYLRFPGGEKSDVYQWASGPNYEDPSTATLARKSQFEFPASSPRVWDLANDTWANANYDFDEFVADCEALGSEPVVSVAFDGIYKPAVPGGTSLTFEQALDLAVGWVRYANVTKKLGIKYWLLGNESYALVYGGGTQNAAQYGRDVATFARAMKTVDPTILVGINGNSVDYFAGALSECRDEVDFLDVHTYPCYGFDEYEDYRTSQLRTLAIVNTGQEAIELQPEPYRSRLFMVMTETSALGYVNGSEWDRGNNIGQALANVEIFGQLAGEKRLRFKMYWNTRWIEPDLGRSLGENFFTNFNDPNATGLLLNTFVGGLKDDMVATTSADLVKVFASKTRAEDELTVFLINRSLQTETIDLALSGYEAAGTASHVEIRGDSVTDYAPEYVELPDLRPGASGVTFAASPLSLTVVRFRGGAAPEDCATNQVPNGGFETGDFANWYPFVDDVASFAGVEFRGGDFAYSGNYIAYIGGVAAGLYQTITGLQPATDYEFSAAVNYYTPSPAPYPRAFVGVKNYGGEAIFRPFTWEREAEYNWEVIKIPFTTGPTSKQAELFLELNAAGSYAWIDEARLTCMPAVGSSKSIQTEARSAESSPVFYPNPTPGELNLPPGLRASAYVVIDVTGRVVAQGAASGPTLDLAHLPPGPYVLTLAGQGKPVRIMRQ